VISQTKKNLTEIEGMLMRKTLNIVSFNIPYPPNYGGVIDVFYRLKTLSESGIDIIFHAFEYGREHSVELTKYCKEVHYYKRKTGIFSQLSFIPYIIYSRRNRELIERLLDNEHPVLFEGIHTCYYLNDNRLKNRLKIVRAHNVEHEYYKGLVRNTNKSFLKFHFNLEAWRLKFYERKLKYADYILSISALECTYFQEYYGKVKAILLYPFHSNQEVVITKDYKPYVLYHGDLSSPENINNAVFLIDKVAKKDPAIPWVIAGLNPDAAIYKAAKSVENVTVKANLSDEEMTQHLREALINILYTSQGVGLKLKLLNAVYNCHFCLANANMLVGTGLEEACVVVPDDAKGLLEKIQYYIKQDFPEEIIEKRKVLLDKLLNNEKNAEKIIALL